MRKEGNNTFTDGLIQDLNPINTPNNVLTDNLNGTIITYDGNEYSLQNDRGNYPLQYCRLKPNYIPVGVKEYADTLYIVSYNPLDNTTEIGSYPSPLEISSSMDRNDAVNIESLIKQSDSSNYTDLIQKAKMHIFSDDDLKIYPGDEYVVNLKDESKYIYEELEYYIIDENRNKYNITEHVKENSTFSPAGWTIPGWMAVQYRLAVFEDFQMNVRSFVVPTLAFASEGKLNLNFQLKISDQILLNRLPDHLDEIGLSISIQKTSPNGVVTTQYVGDELFESINGEFIEWYETSKLLWAQEEFTMNGLNQGDKLSVVVTPFIQVHVDDKTYRVVYDNFTESLDISLTNIGAFSDFKIAGNTWKFWLEDDDPDNLYVEFDITGPIITSNTINLYYRINTIPDAGSEATQSTEFRQLSSYNGIGQNMLLIPFDGIFVPEGMYTIDFIIAEQHPNTINLTTNNCYITKKLVIASKIFSDFVSTTSNFENIDFDTWSSKYSDTIENADQWDIVVDSNNTIGKIYSKGTVSTNGVSDVDIPEQLERFWKTNNIVNSKPYNHTAFISEDDYDEISGEQTKFIRGYETDATIKLETKLNVVNGPLWDGMNRMIAIKVKSHENVLTVSNYKVDNIQKTFEIKTKPIVASTCTVSYEKEAEGLVRGSVSENNSISTVSSNGIKYGIMSGGNRLSGANDYVVSFFSGYYEPLTYENVTKRLTVSEIKESSSKSKLPNSLSRAITTFMTRHQLPYMIVFVSVRRTGKRCIGLKRNGERMFYTTGASVMMQPFIVFRNKQDNPLFFEISGWSYQVFENAQTDRQGYHDIPFKEWGQLNDFINHINSSLGDFVTYKISNIEDGYFLKCAYEYDDASLLNIETEVNIPEISKWTLNGYNLLSSSDRGSLTSVLKNRDITVGNLLSGVTTKLDAINAQGVEYNKVLETPDSVKTELENLSTVLDEINNQAHIQWQKWKTDDIYPQAQQNNNISGTNMVGDSQLATAFKNSSLYELIKTANSTGTFMIGATGESLEYQVYKVDGDEPGDASSWQMGLIHPSITFP